MRNEALEKLEVLVGTSTLTMLDAWFSKRLAPRATARQPSRGSVTPFLGPDRPPVAPRPRVLTFLGLALLFVGGIVRAASGPPVLYLLLSGLSVALFIRAAYQQKRTH